MHKKLKAKETNKNGNTTYDRNGSVKKENLHEFHQNTRNMKWPSYKGKLHLNEGKAQREKTEK